jgi:hypothetical protein
MTFPSDQPAFPTGFITDDKGVVVGGSNGMTLRDYFAAKALHGLLSIEQDGFDPEDSPHFAKCAYFLADAMLKARDAG